MSKGKKIVHHIQYNMSLSFHVDNIHPNGYRISTFFNNTGFSFLLLLQDLFKMASFPLIIKKLEDQNIHNWLSTVNNSPLCVFYRIYKDSFEQYIILCMLSPYLINVSCRFRKSNHKRLATNRNRQI